MLSDISINYTYRFEKRTRKDPDWSKLVATGEFESDNATIRYLQTPFGMSLTISRAGGESVIHYLISGGHVGNAMVINQSVDSPIEVYDFNYKGDDSEFGFKEEWRMKENPLEDHQTWLAYHEKRRAFMREDGGRRSKAAEAKFLDLLGDRNFGKTTIKLLNVQCGFDLPVPTTQELKEGDEIIIKK